MLNVSTAYILDGFEMFFTDLANVQVHENHIISGQYNYYNSIIYVG